MPDPLSGASPDTAQLTPGAISAPDASETPMAAQQSPMSAPQAQPPDSSPSVADQAHSALGRVVRHFASALEGKQTSYVPDPTTGEVQEVQTPRKAGGFFRDILLGAITGGAAGASSPNHESALAGASLGGAAAIQQQQAMQQRQQQQALEKSQRLKNLADANQAKQKEADIAAQTTALGNISVLTHDHMANLHDPKQIDSYNNSSRLVLSALQDKAGARPAQVLGPDGTDLNGKPDNGGELIAMFNKDPQSVMKAPDGWHRSVVTTVDTKGLQQKNGQWVDEAGKPVDLADRTTFNLVDIPASKWGQSLSLTKGTINDVAGAKIMSGKDTDTGTTTVGQMMGLRLKNLQGLNQDIADTYPALDENKFASLRATAQGVMSDPKSTDTQKAKAQKQLDYANNWLQAHGDVKLQDKDKPDDGLPVFKNPLEATGYSAKAAQDLAALQREPKADPKQIADLQRKVAYGQSTAKTLNSQETTLAYNKRYSEKKADDAASIAPNSMGPGALPPDMQARFNSLPDGVKSQMAGQKSDGIAALMAIADGDAELNAAASRVYKGSTQLSQLQVLGLVKQINPKWTKEFYKAKQNMVDDFTSLNNGKPGQNIASFNTFIQHAADASDVVEGWKKTHPDTGKNALWNHSMNWLRQNAESDPGFIQLQAALDPVRSEYKSFLLNNRAEHEQDLKVMDKILSEDATPAVIQEGLKQLAHTGVRRLGSINATWKGLNNTNYPNLVFSDTVPAADKLGLGAEVRKYPSGQLDAQSMRGQGGGSQQLSNISINKQTGQQVGWDGTQYVDVKTRQPLK